MSYKFKAISQRVILDVIARADDSFIGYSFKNFSFYSMSYNDFYTLINHTTKGRGLGLLESKLFEHEIDFYNDKELLIQEFIPVNGVFIEHSRFPIMLQLYKSLDFYSCYKTTYNFDGTNLKFGGDLIIGGYYTHAFVEFKQPKYHLSDEDKVLFPQWYEKYSPQIFGDKNPVFQQILRTYEDSYLVGKLAPQYIMLFTVLEALFGTGNSEITYQVSRGLALLLSKTETEMKGIFTTVKRLYNSRSKYVHSGKDIEQEDLFTLRELTRQLVLKLIDLGYNLPGADFSKLRDQITYSGAGMFGLI